MYNSPIRNNKLIQEAYSKGYRQGLNEQFLPDGTPHPYHVPGGGDELERYEKNPWFDPNQMNP